MQRVPVDTCFHPLRVPRGNSFIYVPCGSCPACRKSFHAKWRDRIEHAVRTHPTTLFITLTYSNEHLPIVTLDPVTHDVVSVTHTRFKTNGTFERVDITDKYLDIDPTFPYVFENFDFSDLPHFVSFRNGDDVVFDDGCCFAICLRKDFQDFVKRLRTLLSRTVDALAHDTSFTYFVCSEYGPDTFRPHYHALLFFNDSHIASICHTRYINEAWKKSSLNEAALAKQSQYVSFGQGASAYVSKYVTCDDVLPSFLGNKFFKPFHSSSHSVPIGSTCIPFTSLYDTVTKTDLLYPKVFKDKDTGEYFTKRVSYPSSFWSRYFPQFLFHGFLSVQTIHALYSRIFALPLYDEAGEPLPCPNRIDEFNSFFHIGEVRHTSPAVYKLRCRESTLIWHKLGAVRPWDRVFYGHPSSDIIYTVTYSDVLPELVKHFDFIDLFLFGIPQNRTVVNKLLNLRRKAIYYGDNWCYSSDSYLRVFNTFQAKFFTNALRNFYDNLSYNNADTSFSPKLIAEYYPIFYKSLPKDIAAFDSLYYSQVESILFNGFGLNVESFYDDNNRLITYDFYNTPFYSCYRTTVASYFREFATKRNVNYKKYGTGEQTPK